MPVPHKKGTKRWFLTERAGHELSRSTEAGIQLQTSDSDFKAVSTV